VRAIGKHPSRSIAIDHGINDEIVSQVFKKQTYPFDLFLF